MQAHIDSGDIKGVALFESDENLLRNKGLLIETAATQPDNNNCVTLAVQNHSLETVCLERCYILGSLYPATVIKGSGSRPEGTSAERRVVRPSLQYDIKLEMVLLRKFKGNESLRGCQSGRKHCSMHWI